MTSDTSIKKTHDAFFHTACSELDYKDDIFQLLLVANREIRLELPLRKDDGSLVVYNAYRVQHNNTRGPYKGGLRYHPCVTMEDARGLACLMSLKTSLMDIPLGGAKGGIDCDPSSLSDRELEKLTRKFTMKIHRNIGPNIDIPAPDIGTDARVMAWIQNEYSKIYGHTPAVVTGKPVVLGGSEGREEATGRGVSIIMQEYSRHNALSLAGKTAVIQGYGNVGSNTARILNSMGVHIIAVSDSRGGAFNPSGLDLEKVDANRRKYGTVAGTEETESIDNKTLLALVCDYLIPAALGHVIDETNAGEIRAGVIVEAANSPVTHEAHEILNDRGIHVLPDILVNAGGVVVSYFEWVQNLQQFSWPVETIQLRLQEKLQTAAKKVFTMVDAEKTTYRCAAYKVATERLKEAFFATGF